MAFFFDYVQAVVFNWFNILWPILAFAVGAPRMIRARGYKRFASQWQAFFRKPLAKWVLIGMSVVVFVGVNFNAYRDVRIVLEKKEQGLGARAGLPSEATEYREKIETLEDEISRLRAADNASVDVVDAPVWSFESGSYVVRWIIHITSKFQRSGVTLNIKSDNIYSFKLIPKLNQKSDIQSLIENKKQRLLYIRNPIGIYLVELDILFNNPVTFSYKFEGDKESKPVTWTAP